MATGDKMGMKQYFSTDLTLKHEMEGIIQPTNILSTELQDIVEFYVDNALLTEV